MLGVNASISNDEEPLLVLENHPDKLMARGLPKEFVAIATEKVSAINEAFGEIAKERGMLHARLQTYRSVVMCH